MAGGKHTDPSDATVRPAYTSPAFRLLSGVPMIRSTFLAALAAVLSLAAAPAAAQTDAPGQHGLAMHGDLKYPPDFPHFDYVNPDAPKGGRLRLGVAETTFDSFNPFIVKGNPAAGIGALYETLLVPSADEPCSPRRCRRRPTARGSSSSCAPRRAGTTASRSRPRT
jgi:hypothetical protein